MNKNNLIRFAESLILLPLLAGTMPLEKINIPKWSTGGVFPAVFVEKDNIGIEAHGILAFNRALDQKARDSKFKAKKAEFIDSYFGSRQMPLFGMGMKMIEEAEKNNLDWRLLPAIAVRESTGGKFDCEKVDNNPFGWGSCKISFKSNEEAIETVAKNLGGNNPNTEKYYADKSVKEILRTYNPPWIVKRYAEQVMSIMDAIGEENIALPEANS